ncbi:hypothetical protein DAPK24_027750 [Pichia kluyveri]|uniref:Uncharacterized protein n=1 Tax=Pichia kluyveri TaxID=36015 RepID=A0AAV5R4G7_PICKL|nr:hypothetical protein DAPK24_027750 [Pichia kluyveri]
MDSKAILESYLDRELSEVVGEKRLHKIVASELKKELNGKEQEALVRIIQKRHEESNMTLVRENVQNLNLVSVVDTDPSLENRGLNDDEQVNGFISGLLHINEKLEKKLDYSMKSRDRRVQELDQLTKSLEVDSTTETYDIHDDIKKFIINN